MQLSRSGVIRTLQDQWPGRIVLGHTLWLGDGRYWLPTLEQLSELCINTFFQDYKYKVEVMDCKESC